MNIFLNNDFMPFKDKEKAKLYLKEWKTLKSIAKGTYGKRGKHEHQKYTEDEFNEKEQLRHEKQSIWRKTYNLVNPKKRLLYSAKSRAKRKNIPCTITEDDILIPDKCPYLGISFEFNAPRGTDRAKVCSLDRIVPELGYIPGNIEVISHLANSMKQHASKEQLVLFAKAVLQRYE